MLRSEWRYWHSGGHGHRTSGEVRQMDGLRTVTFMSQLWALDRRWEAVQLLFWFHMRDRIARFLRP